MTDDTKWKSDLLGSIRPRKNLGKTVNPERLAVPFELETAVIYAFCTGCGLLYELTADQALPLFSQLGKPYHIESDTYFELGSCGMCGSDDKGVVLKTKLRVV